MNNDWKTTYGGSPYLWDKLNDFAHYNDICWPAQQGATEYEVKRSASPAMSSPCEGTVTTNTCWYDAALPPPGTCHYYPVRPTQPNIGSWGQDSDWVEKVNVCP